METRGLKFDQSKPPMELIPWEAVEQAAWVLAYGAEKYAPNSWQQVSNGKQRYLGALLRHASAHARGELLDPETGLPHIAQVEVNAMFLLWLYREDLPQSYDFSKVREKFEVERAAATPGRIVDLGPVNLKINPRLLHGTSPTV